MRADIQKLEDLAERFQQERLSAEPAPVKKLLITTNRNKAKVWCEPCGYGFVTWESWRKHHNDEHIAKHA